MISSKNKCGLLVKHILGVRRTHAWRVGGSVLQDSSQEPPRGAACGGGTAGAGVGPQRWGSGGGTTGVGQGMGPTRWDRDGQDHRGGTRGGWVGGTELTRGV